MSRQLADGTPLPVGYALQDAADYLEVTQAILSAIGRDRRVLSIGIDFTASSPLPARHDGTALSALYPHDKHAYVKLWKHAAAQPYAEAINAHGGAFLDHCGGRLSGEWMLAKAAQLADEAPVLWRQADRFIEAGDWLVWQLTGREVRSRDFAAFKAHFDVVDLYPAEMPAGLIDRLSAPFPVGTPAGALSAHWRARTNNGGDPVVAVAVIDSHAVLPAVGAVEPGTLVGALGTSAVFLLLGDQRRPLPPGIETMAEGAALPTMWCYEAGQAGFGDMLAWFVRTFPRASDPAANFGLYNDEAASLVPGESHLVALDWWNGNRVPFGDSRLSGVIAGLTMGTTAAGLYRALLEALSFGARTIVDQMTMGGLQVDRVLLTSGLAHNNPLLVQIIADVLGRPVEVPAILNPTAVGAAIHGAVAAGVVADFAEGARRFGRQDGTIYRSDPSAKPTYDTLYRTYRDLGAASEVRQTLITLRRTADDNRRV